jgi:glycosyltransferase involved in cell wall biosynthesis
VTEVAPSPGVPWLVVPAFRASSTLGGVLDRLPRWLGERGARVLVVDDGSDDGTDRVARARGAEVLVNDRNSGYARAQKRGLRHALDRGASAITILHADGQYPPEALPSVIAPILSGDADLVMGSRVLDGGARRRGMPAYKLVANRALSWIENRCYGLALSEYHTGMMSYSRALLDALPFEHASDTFHFDGEMAMLAGRRGARVLEVPIEHRYGKERSYLRPIPYGLTVLTIALSVRAGLYDRWLARRAARATLRPDARAIA